MEIFNSNWIHHDGRTETNTPTEIVITLAFNGETVTFTREDNVVVEQSPEGVTVYQKVSDGKDLRYAGEGNYRRLAYYANPAAINFIYQD